MAIAVVYNVYYSTTENGPWTLANTTPITDNILGNSYTVTGLVSNTKYFFMVVGGYIDNDTFVPLVSQAIGPDGLEAIGIEGQIKHAVSCKTFAPKAQTISALGHRFNITSIV